MVKKICDAKTGRMRELRKYERTDGRFVRHIKIGTASNGSTVLVDVYEKPAADLNRKVAEIRYKLNRGLPVVTDNVTVREYAQKWLDTYKANISHQTREMYQNVIANHLYELGDMVMREIKPIEVQSFFNAFAARQLDTTGKLPSKSLLCKTKTVLNQIFKRARKDFVTSINPVSDLEMPNAPEGITRELTEYEQQLFTQTALDFVENGTHQQKRFAIVVLSMLYAGLRRSEAVALHMDSFDMETNRLKIKNAITYEKSAPV